MTYDERYQEILDRYAGFEQEILAREITEEYTEEDQQLDLAENETLKNNELSALNEEYGQIIQNIINSTTQGVNSDEILQRIEDIDIEQPDPVDYENGDLESIMSAIPATIYNTKYVYLTFDGKYAALTELSQQEHNSYVTNYDNIQSEYDANITTINEQYDNNEQTILAKEITETYTEEDQQQELDDNETQRQQALDDNETARTNAITPINETYLNVMTQIATSLTNLKEDRETGFNGDVMINGKLHVDEDINVEGKLNGYLINEYVKQDNFNVALANKSNINHDHSIVDIFDYEPYDDTEVRGLIANKADGVHTHTTFNAPITINVNQGPDDWIKPLILLDNNINVGKHIQIMLGKHVSKDNCATIMYKHGTDYSLHLGFHSYGDLFQLYRNRLITEVPITAPNLKSDNETRLQAVTQSVANLIEVVEGQITHHTHTISDITDYEAPTPYDDTEVRGLIANKSDLNHTHTSFGDITVNKINQCKIGYVEGQNNIPYIKTDTVLEIGKYIDFHDIGDQNLDNTVRLTANQTNLTCSKSLVAPNLKSDNETRLVAIETAKVNNEQRIATLESKVATLETKVTALQNYVTALASDHHYAISEIIDELNYWHNAGLAFNTSFNPFFTTNPPPL
jgi:hypothetical protein